jgi:hypothetical protein
LHSLSWQLKLAAFHGMENAFPGAEMRLPIHAQQAWVQVSLRGAGTELPEVANGSLI